MSGIVDNWYRPEWPLGDRVGVVTTTRHGGFCKRPYDSFNLATHVGDDADAVMANRQRLLEQLALDDIQWLEQVHGIAVIAAGLSTPGTPAADGAWTDQRQLGIAVLTADCVPIVIAADDGSVAGIAHGGWRGLFDGVLRELVAALPAPPAALSAWIGPAISPACKPSSTDRTRRCFPSADDRSWLGQDTSGPPTVRNLSVMTCKSLPRARPTPSVGRLIARSIKP